MYTIRCFRAKRTQRGQYKWWHRHYDYKPTNETKPEPDGPYKEIRAKGMPISKAMRSVNRNR